MGWLGGVHLSASAESEVGSEGENQDSSEILIQSCLWG